MFPFDRTGDQYLEDYEEELCAIESMRFGVNENAMHYNNVELTDVKSADSDPLLDLEKVTTYEEITNWYSNYRNSNYTPNRAIGYNTNRVKNDSLRKSVVDHLLFSETGGFVNPKSGTVFCQTDDVRLMLTSKVSKEEILSWRYFCSKNLNVIWGGERVAEQQRGYNQVMQKLRIRLKLGCDWGFVQFFQSAKNGAENTRGTFPYGSLLTYYFFKGPKIKLGDKVYPPLVSIARPLTRQTYVPMCVGQSLNVILPSSCNFTSKIIGVASPLEEQMCHLSTEAYHCHLFDYIVDIEKSCPLFFMAKDSGLQGIIIIPPIEKEGNKRYAVIESPLSDFVLYLNNIDGVIFRDAEGHFTDRYAYLDRVTKRLKIVSKIVLHRKKECGNLYDLRVDFVDLHCPRIKISNLFDENACQVEATKSR